jgi:hypothetical protein
MTRNSIADRRGSVALWLALITPALTMTLAMAVEVAGWSVVRVQTQRAADVAAVAGTLAYQKSGNAQSAATIAARVAELNGIAGQATPTWNNTSQTLTDNKISASVKTGVVNASQKQMAVTVTQDITLSLAKIFTNNSTVTVTATGSAEMVGTTVTTGGGGGQPCILGLAGDDTGVTTANDVTFQGNTTLGGCTIRSDGGIQVGGSTTINAPDLYAAGTINKQGSSVINATLHQNAGQIPDPYASVTSVQTALTSVDTATATTLSCSNSCTVSPGTYSGISLQSGTTMTMQAGLYNIRGNISLTGQSTIKGDGVTLLMGRGTGSTYSISIAGGSMVRLTAPTTTAAASTGGIAGIVFGSLSSANAVFNGNSSIQFQGLIYYPNGTIDLTGTSDSGSTSGSACTQIIAAYVKLGGNATYTSNGCAGYGTRRFDSMPSTTSTNYNAKLVK